MTSLKYFLTRAATVLGKTRTALSSPARQVLFRKYPVALSIAYFVVTIPIASWIASNLLWPYYAADVAARFLFTTSNALLGSLGMAGAAVIVGFVVYVFRQKARPLYALIELIFGTMLAVKAALPLYIQTTSAPLNEQFVLYAALVTAMYVTVRGWDNLCPFLNPAPVTARLKSRWHRWHGKP